ncbi:NAD+ synthase [Coxiella endosymbiont of Amblyomma nuttalli]|uniref:NAD+ synthase n=1 Tax=Coxiella endosymbiont of Amblyomma nuttalli TaxID=2749996 RepID=UPI001BAC6DFD|nr:NAD+ synthase [Coxiella endosymbiont of Amblyomma nuttalli]QTS84077.1 Glutamine-dependent NAD(+) synthetase [Coxiella endosymbiont of Amblyomma nuttalli]
MKPLTIVGAQINLLVGDIEGNTQLIIDTANRAYSENKADLVLFPELTITSYPPEDLLFRPALYRRVHQALHRIADNIKHTTVIVGYPDCIKDKYYNKAVVIADGKILATYVKHELPNYRVFDEKRYFVAGDQPCVIDIKGVRIGILICEDLWFEHPIKQAMAAGSQLIACINASPFTRNKACYRRSLLAKHADQYHVPIIYLNLVGGQDELVFDGGSMVFDQNGAHVQQGAYFREELMIIIFDIERSLKLLTTTPILSEPLDEEKVYNVLVLGVRDYIEKNNFPGAVIGLSGGVDSALTLSIAVDAIGYKRVSGVLMPSPFTSEISIIDAQAEAKALNVQTSVIDISAIFNAVTNVLASEFVGLKKNITEENLQARIRGMLLMAISNKKGSIVLITGNKSEMAVGYTTLYGDMAGGLAVLKDVYKTMVYRLCRYRNTIFPVIPERILTRPPSAELAPAQEDQDILPPYPILDEILERYIVRDEDPSKIAEAGFDITIVKKVVRMINRNEYKRRQAPIGIRITERAFGKDRRYPITSGFTKDI